MRQPPTRDPRLLTLARLKREMVAIAQQNSDTFVCDAHEDGWNYREIARELGMSASGVQKIVRREQERQRESWERICRMFGGRESE